ncbi:MAG: hypothetical protein ACI4C1_01995 [Lachnospiraceae bacterium]
MSETKTSMEQKLDGHKAYFNPYSPNAQVIQIKVDVPIEVEIPSRLQKILHEDGKVGYGIDGIEIITFDEE